AENTVTLSSYGTALAQAERYEEAFKQFEHSLRIDPNEMITLLLYARALEGNGRYQAAIDKISQIDASALNNDYQVFLYSVTGRLHYLNHNEQEGLRYIDGAIQLSSNRVRTQLYNARGILASTPYSPDAIQILDALLEISPLHGPARQLWRLNLDSKTYFKRIERPDGLSLQDTDQLASTIYHKMINEIVVLKSTLYKIKRQHPVSKDETKLSSDRLQSIQPTNFWIEDIIERVDGILVTIQQKRTHEAQKRWQLATDDYDELINVIAETAHDVADTVNNRLFTIKSRVQRRLKMIEPAETIQSTHSAQDVAALREKLIKVLERIELTESIMNDLKDLHQGDKLNTSSFSIQDAFSQWAAVDSHQHATLEIDIQNAQSIFDGDLPKIRGFINELVENSVRHNQTQTDLWIRIVSKDKRNPLIQSNTIPLNRPYWLIQVRDNGQGISKAKKALIFQPLASSPLASDPIENGSAVVEQPSQGKMTDDKTKTDEARSINMPQSNNGHIDNGSTENDALDSGGLGLFIIHKTLQLMDGYIEEKGTDGAMFEIGIPYTEQHQNTQQGDRTT
ncbi:MAG: ATP-binding protein, partial [Chloroflexota bacterium]